MTQLTPGAIALRVIALTSAVTISACLVVSEQERADQAEELRGQMEALENGDAPLQNPSETDVNDPLAAEQPLAGPPAPNGVTVPAAESFLHTSKAFMPPEMVDPSRFLSSSKSAVTVPTPEIFMSTSKSLSVDPRMHSAAQPISAAEALLRQREVELMKQLMQVREEIRKVKAGR